MKDTSPHTSLTDQQPATREFLQDVLSGLRSHPKQLPCKYFYDERGSQLFDQICELDEYYLTRTELMIMEQSAAEMAAAIGPGARIIEFGSGSSVKTRILLDRLENVAVYAPIDISCEHLQKIAEDLSSAYPDIEIMPVCADFTTDFELPESRRGHVRTVVYFPGSTIGNFRPPSAELLLRRIASICGPKGGLLLGVDLQKDVSVLKAAYNDDQGITAEFNLNLLHHINRELQAEIPVEQFEHVAIYNEALGRIEMHLISQRRQTVTVAGESFELAEHESICTEYSHKYTIDAISRMAAAAGLSMERYWTDSKEYFAVVYFTRRQ